MRRLFVKASVQGKPNDRVTNTQDQQWLTLVLDPQLWQGKTDQWVNLPKR